MAGVRRSYRSLPAFGGAWALIRAAQLCDQSGKRLTPSRIRKWGSRDFQSALARRLQPMTPVNRQALWSKLNHPPGQR
jgi:hypothetical protein